MESSPDAAARTMLTPAQVRQVSAELDLIRRRRELLFWTITTTLAVIVLITMTVALLVSFITGTSIDSTRIALAVGITGASAGGIPTVANVSPG